MQNGTVEQTVAALALEMRELRAENAGLNQRVARMESSAAAQVVTNSPDSTAKSSEWDQRVSRRGALMALGGVAAGGLGLAAGSSLFDAAPAAAVSSGGTQGGALILGAAGANANSASSSTQVLTSAGVGLAGGTGQTGQSGVEGQDLTTKSPYGYGVTGTSDGGTGVYGESTNGTGVYGESTNGSGVYGESTNGSGVYGESTNGTGVEGQTTSASHSAVLGNDISNGAVYGIGVEGTSLGGIGVHGTSQGTGAGVSGSSEDGPGVLGIGGTGVSGQSGGGGVGVSGSITPGPGTEGTGVLGQAIDVVYGVGVEGIATGVNGIGVIGNISGNGAIAVSAEDTTASGGYAIQATSDSGIGVYAQGGEAALEVDGTAIFSNSGVVTVAVGATTATVTGVSLTSSSLVLATLQKVVKGVSVEAATPDLAAGSIRIVLSKAVPTGVTAEVGWFIVN